MSPWYASQWKQSQQRGYNGAWGAASWQKQWPQGGSWNCKDKNCFSAMKAIGLKPKQNAYKVNECEICGVHWNQAAQLEAEKLAAVKKRLQSKQAGDAPIGAMIGVESLTTSLSLPPEYQAIARLLHGPKELTEEFSKETKLLKHRPAGKKAADVEILQEELADQQSLLTLLEKKKKTIGDHCRYQKDDWIVDGPNRQGSHVGRNCIGGSSRDGVGGQALQRSGDGTRGTHGRGDDQSHRARRQARGNCAGANRRLAG